MSPRTYTVWALKLVPVTTPGAHPKKVFLTLVPVKTLKRKPTKSPGQVWSVN